MKWEQVPIKDICIGIYDGPHATPAPSDSGAVFLGITNFVNGRLDLSEIRYISENDLPKWTKRVVPQERDVVFSYEATLNLYAIIPQGFRGCLGRRMALIRVDESKAYYKFLFYYFYSEAWKAVIKENTVLGATVDRIPLIKFPDFPVELPPIETQHRIADVLSAYDDLIENNRKQIKLLEEAAQRLYKEWFVDLRFPGHEHTPITDGIPEGWEKVHISDVAKVNSKSIPKDYEFDYIDYTDLSSVRVGIIEKKTRYALIDAPGRAKRIAKDGDIIWGMVRPNLKSYALVFHPKETDVFSTGFCVLSAQAVPFSYLYCAVTTDDFVGYLVNCTNGAAYPAVKPIHFSEAEILLPTKEVLSEYNKFVEPILRKIESCINAMNQAQEARDRLLPKLMSGEIEV